MIKYEDLYEWLPLPWVDNAPIWKDSRTAYVVTNLIAQADYELEGKLLAHCLGTKNAEEWNKAHRMFSIRGPEGIPHATILCVYANRKSPYGDSADLGTKFPFKVDGRKMRLLQVRGREDDIPPVEFHRIARRFYTEHGGKMMYSAAALDDFCERNSENDVAYHYELMWNPQPWERFNFNYKNLDRAEQARLEGISL